MNKKNFEVKKCSQGPILILSLSKISFGHYFPNIAIIKTAITTWVAVKKRFSQNSGLILTVQNRSCQSASLVWTTIGYGKSFPKMHL